MNLEFIPVHKVPIEWLQLQFGQLYDLRVTLVVLVVLDDGVGKQCFEL
jgi:hypothetical protein